MSTHYSILNNGMLRKLKRHLMRHVPDYTLQTELNFTNGCSFC